MTLLWYFLEVRGFSKGGLIPVGSLVRESSPASVVLTVLLVWLIYTGVDGTLHYLRHRSDHLWLLHKTHHSDPAMDLRTTVFRGEAELMFNLIAFLLLFSVIVSAPWWAIIAAFGLESAFQLVHHANFRPSPWALATIGRIIQLPPHHRIHHALTHTGYFWTFQPFNRLYGLFSADAMPSIEQAERHPTGFDEPAIEAQALPSRQAL